MARRPRRNLYIPAYLYYNPFRGEVNTHIIGNPVALRDTVYHDRGEKEGMLLLPEYP